MNKLKVKSYSSYKDSGVKWLGKIPSHWHTFSNKNIFKLKKNQVGKKSADYVLLSLTLNGVIKRDMENPQGKFPAEFNTYQEVIKGDFIFCLFDVEETPRCVGLSDYDGMITGAYTVMEPNENFDRNFLYYFYLNLDADKRLKPLYTGLRNTISKENFFSFKTFVPPPAEQTIIADFLDRKTALIDQAIDIKQNQIELLKERRQILIHKAVTSGLNPNVKMKDSGVEWIGEIPEGWEVKRLKMILRNENGALKPGPFGSDLKGGDFVEIGYKVYNQRAVLDSDFDISEECINERKYKDLNNFIVKPGDILLTSRGTIGKCSVVPVKYEQGIIHPCIIRLRLNNEIVNNIFIKQYIEWSVTFQASLKLNSNATTIDVIYGNTLSASLFIIPPIKEQSLISEFIDNENIRFNKAISLKEQEIEKLKEYKATLINSAVTGKIKVFNDAK